MACDTNLHRLHIVNCFFINLYIIKYLLNLIDFNQ